MALVFDVLYLFTTSVTTGTSLSVGAKNLLTILNITSYFPANVWRGVHKVGHYVPGEKTTFAEARARLSLCHKTQSRALYQMAYGAQCDKLMRAANALTGLVIFIFTRQCRIPMFEMLAQMAIVYYVREQRKAMTSLHFCTGSPEP